MPRWLKIGGGLAALAGVLVWFLFFDDDGTRKASRLSAPPTSEPAAALNIGFIFPAAQVAEIDVWEETARREEARTRAIATIYRMAPEDPPSKQVELIRKAASEGCSALVILPIDPKEIASVVAEVRKAGTPVIALDVPIPAEGLEPVPVVRFEDETQTAKKLVDAAIADLKFAGPSPTVLGRLLGEQGFPPDGPAMILRHARPDVHSNARATGIRNALEAAGVRVMPDVFYDGLIEEAKVAVRVASDIDPNLAMVFADDDIAMKGASEFRHLLNRKKRRFVLAGYAVESVLFDLARHNVTAGMIDRKITEPVKVAFDTALALARGETVPADIRTPTPFMRRNGAEMEGAFPGFLDHPEGMLGKVPASAGNPAPEAGPDVP